MVHCSTCTYCFQFMPPPFLSAIGSQIKSQHANSKQKIIFIDHVMNIKSFIMRISCYSRGEENPNMIYNMQSYQISGQPTHM